MDYLLSRGFQEQADAYQNFGRGRQDAGKKSLQESVSFLEKFHICREEQKEGPTYLSSYSLALNYLELGDINSADRWSDIAYRIFSPPSVPTKESILLRARTLREKGDFAGAIGVLETNHFDYPFDSQFLGSLGDFTYEAKLWNKSLLYYTSLLDTIIKREGNLDPKIRAKINRNLGDLNYKLDYPKKARKHYLEYLDFAKTDMEALFSVAQIDFLLGDFASAKKYLNRIREINPRDLEASHMLGEIWFIDARESAFAYFEILNKEKKIPKEGVIRYLYQILTGDTSDLEEKLISLSAKNPNRLSLRIALQEVISVKDPKRKFKAYTEAGQIAFQLRQYVTAKNSFQKALALAKKEESLSGNISLILEKISYCDENLGNVHHAVLNVRKAISEAKTEEGKNAHEFRLAYLLSNSAVKKYDASLSVSSSLIAKQPSYAPYYYLRGLTYLQKENYKAGLKDFDKAVSLEQNNAIYLFYRAMAYDKLNDFPNAEKDLLLSMESNPDGSNTYNYLGYLYAEKGIKKDKSLTYLKKAVELEPDNAAYLDSLGWIYFKSGHLKEALVYLLFAENISTARDAFDPVISDHIGDVYHSKKDLVNALAYWEKSLAKTENAKEKIKIQTKIKSANKELSE